MRLRFSPTAFLAAAAIALAAAAGSGAGTAQSVYLGLRSTGVGGNVGVAPSGVLDHCASDGRCYFRFDAGAVVTLTASTADPAATFVRWLGACAGSQQRCTLTLDRSRSVTARFTPLQLEVGSTVGQGSVSITPAGPSCGPGCTSVAYGSQTVLVAEPCCGYSFDHWDGACASVASSGCRLTMFESDETTPVFRCDGECLGVSQQPLTRDVPAQFEVRGHGRITVNGQPCTATCAFSFTRSQPLVLRAQPPAGSRFVSWSGSCVSTAPRCLFSAFRDSRSDAPSVVATFSP
jgi:Divergent InlB B-repeat domain